MTDLNLFFKRIQGIALSNNERLAMRERLAAYADMHPMLAPAERATIGIFSFLSARSFPAYAFALMLIVATGGGVSFAATSSVPGDSLYALKIHVTEPLESALAPTAEGQARVASAIATRRVDEAVTLAARGTLTPERKAYLSQEFDTSIKRAASKADALASSGDATGAATVKANLAADLAGEAQALGAVTTSDSASSADFLQTVVATSESITESDGGSTVVAVNAVALARQATTTTAAKAARPTTAAGVRTAAMAVQPTAATSTSARPQMRFGRLQATDRIAPASVAAPSLAAPKVDAAIPTAPSLPSKAGHASDIELGN